MNPAPAGAARNTSAAASLARPWPPRPPPSAPPSKAAALQQLALTLAGDGLDEASNRVVDLIDAGRLDDAETAAHDLLRDYPEVIDGLERLGMVYQARGDYAKAADYYRQAADFIRDNPDGFDPESEFRMRERVDKLAPTSSDSPDPGKLATAGSAANS